MDLDDLKGNPLGFSIKYGIPSDLSRFPFGSIKMIRSLFHISKWKSLLKLSNTAFKIIDQERNIIIYSTKIGDDVIKFGGEFEKVDDVLTIKNFDIDGNLTNKLEIS